MAFIDCCAIQLVLHTVLHMVSRLHDQEQQDRSSVAKACTFAKGVDPQNNVHVRVCAYEADDALASL